MGLDVQDIIEGNASEGEREQGWGGALRDSSLAPMGEKRQDWEGGAQVTGTSEMVSCR